MIALMEKKEDHKHDGKTIMGLTIRQLFDCQCWWCNKCLSIVEFCEKCKKEMIG